MGSGPSFSGLVAVTLFTTVALILSFTPGALPDFVIYRAGAELTLRGENPYDLAKTRAIVAAEFPDDNPQPDSFVNNCGYFLPPQAVVLFLPFALFPLPVAKVAWVLLHGAVALAIVRLPGLLKRPGDPAPGTGLISRFIPVLLLLNFFTIAVVMNGQVSVVAVGCVAAGLLCFERGGRWWAFPGVLAWSVAFMKPHVALPLIPLAWYLGGWKRAAALAATVAVMNALGAILVGGSPLFLRDYFAYLADSHLAVLYNQAELNYEMPSWNRLLYVATSPFVGDRFLVEQSTPITLCSYLVWFALIAARCGLSGVKPSAAWAAAATAVGAVVCPQVLGYEAMILLLAVPWVRELFADGRRAWGWAAGLVLGLQTIPLPVMERLGIDFHRPLGVALFALLVLLGAVGNTCQRRRGIAAGAGEGAATRADRLVRPPTDTCTSVA